MESSQGELLLCTVDPCIFIVNLDVDTCWEQLAAAGGGGGPTKGSSVVVIKVVD